MIVPWLLATMLASPADDTPQAFVHRLYVGYRDPDYSPLARPERIFARPLVEAIREDARLSRGEVGFMDSDPLCQCQDPAGLSPTVAGIRRPTPATAIARLILSFGDTDRRELSLRLVRTRSGWRIADIGTDSDPSLLSDLRRFNRRRR
jgi:hypothetical protein